MPTDRSDSAVLIVDDHELFAESLAITLRLQGYDVRRPTLTRNLDVIALAERLRPRVALLDLDLGELGDGGHLIAPLTKQGTDVVVVTASSDRAEWGGCLQLGASTVLGKNGPLETVTTTVHRLFEGLPVLGRVEREALLEQWRRERRVDDLVRDRFARLTVREREVLLGLVEGHGVHDIATSDVVSEATVRTQVRSILAKLEVSSQLAAVGLAHRVGWQGGHRPHGSMSPPTSSPSGSTH